MYFLFGQGENSLGVVEYKQSWDSSPCKARDPEICVLAQLDTINRLTVRKDQPSWDIGPGSSPMTRLRHGSALTLSSPSTKPYCAA
jgi:hypothetical protein